ncbi:MAG: hypothetical protein F9K23_13860 [Bacteroidetes bacterium]|nr:MAG: hypothetical protein F9K23_13860 [Bacteroidota bacterium]
MLRNISIFFIFACTIQAVFADDTLRKFNIRANYSANYQFFTLNGAENATLLFLADKMTTTNGFFEKGAFKPTLLQQVSLSAAIFKNKTWYVGLKGYWGQNEVSSNGYIANLTDNTIEQYKCRSWFKIWYMGYYVQKEFRIKKRGTISPYIGFFPNTSFYMETSITKKATDIETGRLVTDLNMRGGSQGFGSRREGILMLFDNPQIGVDFSLKLLPYILLTASYSYLWYNSVINDLYSSESRYIIPFENSQTRPPLKLRGIQKEFFSSGISLGLAFQLYK